MTLGKRNLIDIFGAFHPKVAEYTFCSSAHGTFSGIDNMFGHETSLSKFRKDDTKYFLRPQCYESRNQIQGNTEQTCIHMETE